MDQTRTRNAMKRTAILCAFALSGSAAVAQTKAPLPPIPPPQSVPKPAADTGGPYAPQAILPGGIVVPLFAPSSPYLKADKIHVPEVYNMSQTVHGRISSIVSIHNPSIEVHMVEKGDQHRHRSHRHRGRRSPNA